MIVLGEIFSWPPEVTGWPGLAIIGITSVLHVEMRRQAREDERRGRQLPN